MLIQTSLYDLLDKEYGLYYNTTNQNFIQILVLNVKNKIVKNLYFLKAQQKIKSW